ncbi:DNA-processing protein DprA [Macrococcus equipercicus]|uniref:DNA-processing protein DprA n=1 Tax=Macrococcus equipercicus TaxID=69967 RepID=A0A9Q9F252_9STAP|nr:DNA-processing protein DprA [Macrococcus equipercicus]KAA1036955.1 DNA-protecting protein DprA [Macrococcus equipercicus]UTH14667.1 DNA-processing protein DprA [Macrococcus equipercicus]
MEQDMILKLIYAGFSTAQLHRFKERFGCFNYISLKYEALLKEYQDPALRKKLKKLQTLDSSALKAALHDKGMTLVYYNEANYPALLRELYDYPWVLFCRGNTDYLTGRCLAVVGGRERTEYTTTVLTQFIPELTRHQLVIVSGLAKGTDSDAHIMTMRSNGRTIGVLGFGHDHHYPEETALLRKYMERQHLVISEYPPHVSPRAWQFPERNRIISGLCQGTLITEAKRRSGSLITCDQALDQNRNVYCLPGPITSVYSEGCNLRISEGAKACLSVADILEDYQ